LKFFQNTVYEHVCTASLPFNFCKSIQLKEKFLSVAVLMGITLTLCKLTTTTIAVINQRSRNFYKFKHDCIYRSFSSSKFYARLTKILQLLRGPGATPYRVSAPGLRWGTSVRQTLCSGLPTKPPRSAIVVGFFVLLLMLLLI
jgi:hypothetical protein